MVKDFTIETYKQLLSALKNQGYSFQPFRDYITRPKTKSIILRHDVDARKTHSLYFARIQHKHDICGTYYFRVIPQSFDEDIIKEIESLGHEIGYHYEDMDFANGHVDQAYELAKQHLAKLREIANIQTICMHGSPCSSYDNKEVWRKYDYEDLGIIGEPYFDLDFNKVFYLTDTGRMWDGKKISLRDTVDSQAFYDRFHSTFDIISAVKQGRFPEQAMINIHPQRWTDNEMLWGYELVVQSAKNLVKFFLKKIRN